MLVVMLGDGRGIAGVPELVDEGLLAWSINLGLGVLIGSKT